MQQNQTPDGVFLYLTKAEDRAAKRAGLNPMKRTLGPASAAQIQQWQTRISNNLVVPMPRRKERKS